MAANTRLLSILIPVHDWDITELAHELAQQIRAGDWQDEVDLHIFNDASTLRFGQVMRGVCAELRATGLSIHLHETEVNVGRAVARNALLSHSAGRALLFLDADVLPDEPSFLGRYVDQALSGREAVCGGVSYRRSGPVPEPKRFYHRYSASTSVAPAEVRNRCPWAWIFTANMLVSRRLADLVPFDAGFVGYGYEDIEWGLRLHQQCEILHLDNAVSHLGLLDKAVLQRKYRESAANLVYFARLHPVEAGTLNLVRLARRLSRLPAWVLRLGVAASRALFGSAWLGYRVEWLGMQLEKAFRAAVAFKAERQCPAGGSA